jgi:uncharacterized membrane protein YccC
VLIWQASRLRLGVRRASRSTTERDADAGPAAPGSFRVYSGCRQVILFAVIRAVAGSVAVAFGLHQPNADWMPVATIVAMKPGLQQSALVAEQRLAGAVIGAVVAAAFPADRGHQDRARSSHRRPGCAGRVRP